MKFFAKIAELRQITGNIVLKKYQRKSRLQNFFRQPAGTFYRILPVFRKNEWLFAK